jgi:hypothetical protein
MQAIEAPVLKTTMVAALALGAFAIPMRAAHHERGHVQQHMLVLHAPVLEHAIYLTAWSAGDFTYPLDVDHLQPLHFKMKAYISDGCHWLGEETLVPDGERRFAYTYEETILSCEPGSTPAIKTPRTGFVTIDQ